MFKATKVTFEDLDGREIEITFRERHPKITLVVWIGNDERYVVTEGPHQDERRRWVAICEEVWETLVKNKCIEVGDDQARLELFSTLKFLMA